MTFLFRGDIFNLPCLPLSHYESMKPDMACGKCQKRFAVGIAASQIKWQGTIVDGIEQAPQAFIGLFKGENVGKMLVRLA